LLHPPHPFDPFFTHALPFSLPPYNMRNFSKSRHHHYHHHNHHRIIIIIIITTHFFFFFFKYCYLFYVLRLSSFTPIITDIYVEKRFVVEMMRRAGKSFVYLSLNNASYVLNTALKIKLI
jgi:hypothetical protein